MNKEQHKMSRFTDNYSPYNGNAMNLICCYSYTQTTEFINKKKEIVTQRTVQNQNNTREKANFNRHKNE